MKKFRVVVNGEVFEVEVEEIGDLSGQVPVSVPPSAPVLAPLVSTPAARFYHSRNDLSLSLGDAGAVTSTMPGMINDIKVKPGDQIKLGDVLIVLEAMKMENLIKADIAGTVKEIRVAKGQAVNSGDPLVIIS